MKFKIGLMVIAVSAIIASVVIAETYTNAVGGASLPVATAGGIYKLTGSIDFSTLAPDANEDVAVIKVPAKTYVLAVNAYMSTACTNLDPSVCIGDSGSSNAFLGATSLATLLTNQCSAYTTAKAYPIAGTNICVKFSQNPGNVGVMQIRATVIDLR